MPPPSISCRWWARGAASSFCEISGLLRICAERSAEESIAATRAGSRVRIAGRPSTGRPRNGWSAPAGQVDRDGCRAHNTTNHAESGTPSERYRYTVARETPSIFAMSVAVMPLSRSVRALAAAASSTLRGRPPLRPLAAATSSPARVRSINSHNEVEVASPPRSQCAATPVDSHLVDRRSRTDRDVLACH